MGLLQAVSVVFAVALDRRRLVLAGEAGHGDAFDFDEGVFREAGYLDGGTGGWHVAFWGEVAGVDLVHGGEVVHVLEEDGGLENVGEREVDGVEDGAEVFADALGLLGDAAFDEVAGGGVDGDLAGGVDEIADTDGLRVGADGGGSVGGGDDELLRHGDRVIGAQCSVLSAQWSVLSALCFVVGGVTLSGE